jgi:outer membrane immunogenic protein
MRYWGCAIGGVFGMLASQMALATDLPATKAPPSFTPPPAFSWTGFTLSAGGGYGEWAAETTTRRPGSTSCVVCTDQVQGGHGFLGRIGIGFDDQFAQRFVAGLFADGSFSNGRGSLQDQAAHLVGSNIDENWSWAVGGRLGVLVTPDIFAYANAGFTQTRFTGSALQNSLDASYPGNALSGFVSEGWFVGGGLESLLAPGWYWRSEYRLADYGARTLIDQGAAGRLDDVRIHPVTQTVTSGIVYKFGPPGAGPAPGLPDLGLGNFFGDIVAPVKGPSIWSGFYANAGAGYGFWSADTVTQMPGTGACVVCIDQRQGGRGGAASLGLGYDYQLTKTIVAGVFGDFDPAGLQGTIQDQAAGASGTISEDWAWGGGARVGVLATPQVLAYNKIGFTQAHFGSAQMRDSQDGALFGLATQPFTASGWLIGDGIEAQFAPGWFWRVEYRYAEYDAHAIGEGSANGLTTNIRFHPEVQTGIAGLVYRFNWTPAPLSLAARY